MAIYGIFSFIDGAIFSMVRFVVRLIIIIANYDFFKTEVINEVTEKVYVVLGVLVLFKIVITCIQYMINPDTFDDKEKGMAGLLKKAAISMGLLVLVQPLFNFALEMQNVIVATIPGLVIGDDSDNYRLDQKGNANSAKKQLDEIGDMVAGSTIWSFVSHKEEFKKRNIDHVSYQDGVGSVKEENGKLTVISGTVDGFRENITAGCDGAIWSIFSTEKCVFEYKPLLSTAAGIFLLYVLISLCLDVGIRVIKLGILQMLAPIPIGSYIVNKDKLSKFVKLTTQVYVDLFIRLGVIYFIIFFVRKVVEAIRGPISIAKGNYVTDDLETMFIKVIIIIALFMFAKKAPQFICEVLGIDNKGMGDMADMFKPAWQRAGAFGAGAGMITAGVGNAINKAKYIEWQHGKGTIGKNLKNVVKIAGSATAGATSAGFHGGMAALQGKNTKEVNAAGYRRAIKARQNRDLDKANGITSFDRIKTRAINELGIDTKANLAENKQKAYSTLHSDVGAFKKAVMGRIDKNPTVAMRSNGGAMSQLGKILYDSRDIIKNGNNEDLKNILKKFELSDVIDKNGQVIGQTYKLKNDERLGYYDLEAIRVNAEQSNIGSISGKMEPLKTIAQKELFSDAMAGTVVDISGNLMDEFNYGNAGYTQNSEGKWINSNGEERKQAHSDVTTAVQSAMQHITENGVPLGMDTTLLQKWFQGTIDVNNEEDKKLLASLPPDLQSKIIGKDFGTLDDEYQRRSEKLSAEMASSKEHLARASLERRNANKDKK